MERIADFIAGGLVMSGVVICAFDALLGVSLFA